MNFENENYTIVPLEQLFKQKVISQLTYEKVTLAKKYIERKYNIMKIKNMEDSILIDKIKVAKIPENKKKELISQIESKNKRQIHKKLNKLRIQDYTSIGVIGKGAFGEVHVCRNNYTKELVAIKKIKKENLIKRNQLKHTMNEQLFLSQIKSQWVVDLKESFQQGEYLFLVMEFLQGGDFMNLLIKKDTIPEEDAKFYICEIILAIESIHKLNCIHRDIKPDNVLIGKDGHIKLTDFGLSKIPDIFKKEDLIKNNIDLEKEEEEEIPLEYKKHDKNFSCVGTAYYVAPEVLEKKGYGPEVDWWSLGIIIFEMIYGYAPFQAEKSEDICYKVLHFQKYFKFPQTPQVSKELKDLIKKIVTIGPNRLGINGAEEIKNHPFFKGINWNKIREMKPPFIPKLASNEDLRYFDEVDNLPLYPHSINVIYKRKDPEYIGYTYKNESDEEEDNFLNIVEQINLKQEEEFLKAKEAKEKEANKIEEDKKEIKAKVVNIENDLILINNDIMSENPANKNKRLKIIPLPLKPIRPKKKKSGNLNINVNINVNLKIDNKEIPRKAKSPDNRPARGFNALMNSISSKISKVFKKNNVK